MRLCRALEQQLVDAQRALDEEAARRLDAQRAAHAKDDADAQLAALEDGHARGATVEMSVRTVVTYEERKLARLNSMRMTAAAKKARHKGGIKRKLQAEKASI